MHDDQFFGPVITTMEENIPNEKYSFKQGILRLSTVELCVPNEFVKMILYMANDSLVTGHYAEAKT